MSRFSLFRRTYFKPFANIAAILACATALSLPAEAQSSLILPGGNGATDSIAENGATVAPDTALLKNVAEENAEETFEDIVKDYDIYDILTPDQIRQQDASLADDLYLLSTISKARRNLKGYDPNRNWWHLLRTGQLKLNDPSVEYPRFIGFCVKVYNWADKAFNAYDPRYVVATGKRWKARITNENWVDSHAMRFRDPSMSMRMMSDVTCTLGAYLQYMAVSVGYSFDMTNIIGNKPLNRKKLSIGFNCARFNIEAYYQENTGGSYMRTFGKYRNGHLFKKYFPGLTFYSYGIEAYYFFNNKKYSQGAAYNFSKIQLRSQGSFLAGLSFTDIDNTIDFTTLPSVLRPFLNMKPERYRFHYRSYCVQGGYGFNWVWGRHFLFNITGLPRIGVASCYEDSYDGTGTLLALGVRGRTSITYNDRNFFICVAGYMDGNWYNNGDISMFSSIENMSASIGIRF